MRSLTTFTAIGLAIWLLATGGVAVANDQEGQQAQKPSSDPMQFARGAEAWKDNCGRCHNLRSPGEFSDEDWGLISMHMRVRANLAGETARDIEAFLKASN